MPAKRNSFGKIVKGRGAELTDLQSEFLERIRDEGMDASSKVAKEMNYTNYYRDRRTSGTISASFGVKGVKQVMGKKK